MTESKPSSSSAPATTPPTSTTSPAPAASASSSSKPPAEGRRPTGSKGKGGGGGSSKEAHPKGGAAASSKKKEGKPKPSSKPKDRSSRHPSSSTAADNDKPPPTSSKSKPYKSSSNKPPPVPLATSGEGKYVPPHHRNKDPNASSSDPSSSSLPPRKPREPTHPIPAIPAWSKPPTITSSSSSSTPSAAASSRPLPNPSSSTPTGHASPANSRPLSPSNPVLHYRHPAVPASHRTKPDPRSAIPAEVLCCGGSLHEEILASWKASEPSGKVITARRATFEKVCRAVARFGPQYKVGLFGSAEIGVDNATSDLDLCVIDDDRPDGYSGDLSDMGDMYASNMRPLERRLKEAGLYHLETRSRSRTPIVKARDPQTHIEIDINVNDLGGLNNSALLLSYFSLAPYTLRPLTFAVKLWAKARGMNNPSGDGGRTATFSSYALTLLVISYLQTLPTPLLPNLQSPSLISRCAVPSSTIWTPPHSSTRKLATKIDTTFVPVLDKEGEKAGRRGMGVEEAERWRKKNLGIDLGGLLKGFFARFGERLMADENGGPRPQPVETERIIEETAEGVERANEERGGPEQAGERRAGEAKRTPEWKWLEWVASPLKGGMERREKPYCFPPKEVKIDPKAVQPPAWRECWLVVQDPFIWHKNCTMAMHEATAKLAISEFARAYDLLASSRSFTETVCEKIPPKVQQNGHPSGGGGRPRGAGNGGGGGSRTPKDGGSSGGRSRTKSSGLGAEAKKDKEAAAAAVAAALASGPSKENGGEGGAGAGAGGGGAGPSIPPSTPTRERKRTASSLTTPNRPPLVGAGSSKSGASAPVVARQLAGGEMKSPSIEGSARVALDGLALASPKSSHTRQPSVGP